MKRKDFTNRKYNRLTFVRLSDRRTKDNRLLWEVLCDCGTTTLVDSYSVSSGHTKSCGCLVSETAPKNSKLGKRKYDPITTSARRVWTTSTYRQDCEFEVFLEMSQKDCHYCGR